MTSPPVGDGNVTVQLVESSGVNGVFGTTGPGITEAVGGTVIVPWLRANPATLARSRSTILPTLQTLPTRVSVPRLVCAAPRFAIVANAPDGVLMTVRSPRSSVSFAPAATDCSGTCGGRGIVKVFGPVS